MEQERYDLFSEYVSWMTSRERFREKEMLRELFS